MRVFVSFFYRVTHSLATVLGFCCVVLLGVALARVSYFAHTVAALAHDPRFILWSAVAAGAVIVYDRERLYHEAALSRGNRRLEYSLATLLSACIVAVAAYLLIVCGCSILFGRGLDVFRYAANAALPLLATIGLAVLLATLLPNAMVYLAVALVLLFAVWTGVGMGVDWLCAVFPPYLQGGAVAWVAGSLWVVGAAVGGYASAR